MSTMPTVKVPSHCMLQSKSYNRLTSFLVKHHSYLGSVRSVSRTFGLKSIPLFRATAMASYKMKLIGPDGKENEFEAPDDSYILDSAESAGIELPYSCRAGACSTSCRKAIFIEWVLLARRLGLGRAELLFKEISLQPAFGASHLECSCFCTGNI